MIGRLDDANDTKKKFEENLYLSLYRKSPKLISSPFLISSNFRICHSITILQLTLYNVFIISNDSMLASDSRSQTIDPVQQQQQLPSHSLNSSIPTVTSDISNNTSNNDSAAPQPNISSHLPADPELKLRLSQSLQQSAELIKSADILFLHTGAGFSADSGLPIYNEIANHPAIKSRNLTYRDLCNPSLLLSDELLFLGFWGYCFNQYRDISPHRGYQIIKKWKENKFHSNNKISKLIRKEMEVILKEKIDDSKKHQQNTNNINNHQYSNTCPDSSTVKLEVERAKKRAKISIDEITDDQTKNDDEEEIEIVHAESTLHIHRDNNNLDHHHNNHDNSNNINEDFNDSINESFTSTINEIQERRIHHANNSNNNNNITDIPNITISRTEQTPKPSTSTAPSYFSILNNSINGSSDDDNENLIKSLIPDSLGSFYSFTSNVDDHFIRAGFHSSECYAIHGNSETWQCSELCTFDTWSPNAAFRFDIDEEKMFVKIKTRTQAFIDNYNSDDDDDSDDDITSHHWTASSSFSTHRPVCPFGHLARPRILMFNDQNFLHDTASEERYLLFLHAVLNIMEKDLSLNIVILEIGCGMNIPTVRQRSEAIYTMIKHNTTTIKNYQPNENNLLGRRALIRVNPYDSNIQFHNNENSSAAINNNNISRDCVSVPLNGLLFIEIIDRLINQQQQSIIKQTVV